MRHISANRLILLASFYFSTVFDIAFWRFMYQTLKVEDLSSFVFALSLPFVIFLTLWLFFNIICFKYLTKPLLTILTITSSAAAFAMWRYGVLIDADMFQNVVETDINEIHSLISLQALLWLFVTAVLPLIWLWSVKIEYAVSLQKELQTRALKIGLATIILGVLFGSSFKEYVSFCRNHREARKLVNTFNYLAAINRYTKRVLRQRHEFVVLDATPSKIQAQEDSKKRLIVLVIGETARADNFSLYGYTRNTNPLLSRENLTIFQNVEACGTSTTIALPCIFSAYGRADYDVSAARYTQNLLDMAQTADYRVIWQDNDGGCKGVCNRVPTTDLRKVNDTALCREGACFDEILLKDFDRQIGNLPNDTLLVLHMMGSHGPTYFERYPEPFKKFRPTCETADLPECTKEEIINTYDNTILYTDYVLAKIIERLKAYPDALSAMLYVSDHGESLGENNIYLHGLPYGIAPDTQKRVPMMLWLSPALKKADQIDTARLKVLAKEQNLSHDNVFHTLLGLLKVRSTTYRQDLDLLTTN